MNIRNNKLTLTIMERVRSNSDNRIDLDLIITHDNEEISKKLKVGYRINRVVNISKKIVEQYLKALKEKKDNPIEIENIAKQVMHELWIKYTTN